MENTQNRQTATELLSKLAEAHGASGREGAVRRVFREELGSADTDRMGNIYFEKRGGAPHPRIMLSGHMDEVGFVVQTITSSGLIKFLPVGGWWSHTLLAHRVRILTRSGAEILGVIGAKPPHFLTDAEREKLIRIDDMFIDVGATSGEDVRDRFGIRLGDGIVPESPFTPMHNPDFLLCKAFDNRVGMALTIHALKLLRGLEHPNTVVGVGTVQEEFGVRGAQTVGATVEPDVAIVLEGTPADDFPGIPEDERQGAVGRGVQIRVQDPSAILDPAFVSHAVGAAESEGIPHQVAVRRSGATDARAIQLHNRGVPTIVLGVPARYIHTHNSIIRMDDYLSALRLIMVLLRNLDTETCESFGRMSD